MDLDLDLDSNHLLRPLLTPSNTTSAAAPPLDGQSSNTNIILRFSLVLFIGVISIWANHEASKGFAVTILNESINTTAGKRFQLFYVSNDEATRAVIEASRFVEDFLYSPNCNPQSKKPVEAVALQLTNRTLPESVIVEGVEKGNQFVIKLSPEVMEGEDFENAFVSAVRRGVARVWLWDGRGQAPANLIDGVVEYITAVHGGGEAVTPAITGAACWEQEDPLLVAQLLNACERRRPEFVRRLNEAMKDGWDAATLVCELCTNE